jgi:hypothetical protein
MSAKLGPAYAMSNEHRDKIKNSNILNVLIEHTEGRREMSSSQVTAGLGLLRKVLPDLTATTLEGGDPANPISIYSYTGVPRFGDPPEPTDQG